MLTQPLFIDITTGNLLANLQGSATVTPQSLLFYAGDTVAFQLYFLTPAVNPTSPLQQAYTNVGTAGISPQLFLTDGTESGPHGDGNPYTWQIIWTPDPTGSFFTALLALNTAALLALVATTPQAQVVMKIGFYQGGYPQTVFSGGINIGVGIPSVAGAPPAPMTPLSVQVANQTYMPIQPVPGQPLYLESLNGKIIELVYVDLADGSAQLQMNPLN